ncbi:MAG: deoxyribose-phosphate aldolase [Bacteroidales bacterium]|nr:deoxyribose-phosphate aldolase [Bacteroidales bacterium]
MDTLIKELFKPADRTWLAERTGHYKAGGEEKPDLKDLRKIFGVIDLTTLDVRDTDEKVEKMCRQVNHLPEAFPEAGAVAGVCVYPVFIPVVKKMLANEHVRIVSVAAGFPASQTFREVKTREVALALDSGAQEIDVVISVGKILTGKTEETFDEIREIRTLIGKKGHLKVILESGVLNDPDKVQQAALVAMTAGADFIKTSTGKVQPAARPEDIIVMADTVKRYYQATGKKNGIKPAGGISTPEGAFLYMKIIRDILGEEWINPSLFRIGASRLANQTLGAMLEKTTGRRQEIQYF